MIFSNRHHHGRFYRYCQPDIIPMCSFHDENNWFFYLRMDVLSQVVGQCTAETRNPSNQNTAALAAKSRRNRWSWSWGTHGRCNKSRTVSLPVIHGGGQGSNPHTLPCGTLFHVGNSILATLLIVWFLWNHHVLTATSLNSSSSKALSSSSRQWSVWYIYLSQFGLVYDNGVNAIGRYLGEGQLLRILNKNRFTLHVTVIPLLGIAVTEIAGRYSLFGGSMHGWICSVLSGWSFLDLTKWQFFRHSQHLQLVDNRANTANQGPHLSGTLSYTSGAFWEMCLPPVLLVLYELMVGFVILIKSEFPVQHCMTLDRPFDSFMLLDKVSPPHEMASCSPPWSAIYLILSGLLTLTISSKSLRYPELQLVGENLHGILLWAAYTTP